MWALPVSDPAIEISLATRGYSKGVAQTNEPQVVVRPEVKVGPVLVSAYAKNVSSLTYEGEAGVSGSYRTKLAGFDLFATATVKTLLDPARGQDTTALELIGGVARTAGPFTARVNCLYSPDELGTTGRSHYWEGIGSYTLGKGFVASAGAGLRRRAVTPDYTSYNAGLSYTLSRKFTADVRWFGSNRSELDPFYKSRLVGALRARF